MSQISIVQSDIEAVFGSTFVAQWSNTGSISQSPSANSARIAVAINYGASQVNGRLQNSQYTTPLSATNDTAVPIEIVDAMATFAGYWLFRTSGLNYTKDTLRWMESLVQRAEKQLISIRIGNYPVACVTDQMKRTVPFVTN